MFMNKIVVPTFFVFQETKQKIEGEGNETMHKKKAYMPRLPAQSPWRALASSLEPTLGQNFLMSPTHHPARRTGPGSSRSRCASVRQKREHIVAATELRESLPLANTLSTQSGASSRGDQLLARSKQTAGHSHARLERTFDNNINNSNNSKNKQHKSTRETYKLLQEQLPQHKNKTDNIITTVTAGATTIAATMKQNTCN
ncbi:hypothetical protein PoB_004411100 [Plakobranchus ocellatus]|uniref:Uncharacterized protein n=1 Tax=Plakobranchus ocellatus TaxID=259542 RepID=A0AAV4B2M8_9GAST|nr:hypothetical protein PoB_004411100 [Plakobranchus ocellatus]